MHSLDMLECYLSTLEIRRKKLKEFFIKTKCLIEIDLNLQISLARNNVYSIDAELTYPCKATAITTLS